MLARALAAKPRLLIIDEALDHIDDVREREQLLNAVFSRDQEWTLFVVSASPDVLERCERVYAISSGQLEPIAPFKSIRSEN